MISDCRARFRYVVATGLAAALLFSGSEATAMWAKMTQVELVQASPLIVLATLEKIVRIPMAGNGGARPVGVLRIENVLKGDSRADIALIALPDPDEPIISSDLTYKVGQTGLWFLHPAGAEEGAVLFAADHPQRFVAADQAATIVESLRRRLGP